MDNIFAPVINWLSLNTWLPPLLTIFVSVAGIAFVFGPARKQAKLAERKFNLDQQIAIRNQDRETETGRNVTKAEVAKFDAEVKKTQLMLGEGTIEERKLALCQLKLALDADPQKYGKFVVSALCGFLKKIRSPEYVATEKQQRRLSLEIEQALEFLKNASEDYDTTILGRVDLDQAELRRAKLTKARLPGANLFGIQLQWAELFEADFTKADMRKANLREASFRQAIFIDANLTDADLRSVKATSGADFLRASLTGARLEDANLTDVINLTHNQLKRAFGNNRTKLPTGVICRLRTFSYDDVAANRLPLQKS